MIEIVNLSKSYEIRANSGNKIRNLFFPSYRNFKALDNITLSIKKGELFALLGPNGAGKTTLIKLICGLIEPSCGKVTIDNKSPGEQKIKIGVMLGNKMIYHRLTGYNNLKYFAKLYGVEDYDRKIKQLAGLLGIGNWLNQLVETYSTGMLSKLALARALINDPEILILDEPTLGLDPFIAMEIRKKIKQTGKTIILATHYLEEAESLADRIGILNRGRLIKVGTKEDIKKFAKKKNTSLFDSISDIIKNDN